MEPGCPFYTQSMVVTKVYESKTVKFMHFFKILAKSVLAEALTELNPFLLPYTKRNHEVVYVKK